MKFIFYSAFNRRKGNILPTVVALLFLICTKSITAQISIKGLTKVDNGLYFLTFDSTSIKSLVTKSTIVEFDTYIAMIEMPIVYTGGSATTLKEYNAEGETIRSALQEYFPNKPLKYILSSHWHPHSIASVTPFISRGTTLITTHKNFSRIRTMLDSATISQYSQNICYVDDDSLNIQDGSNSITCYKLTKKDYPNVPTEDYLYFYLPKYNYFYSSCMFQRLSGIKVCEKELISGRVEDVSTFMHKHSIMPTYLLGFTQFNNEVDGNGKIPCDSLYTILNNGIKTSTILSIITSFTNEQLTNGIDSVITYIITNKIPASYVNIAVYQLLEMQKIEHALLLAKLQTVLNPSDANAWDTLGECYYFLGNKRLAKFYEVQSLRINKDFLAGEKEWAVQLEEYKAKWSKK